MIFMGQEFLNWEDFDDSRPLDWTNAGPFSGITQLYRDLIHLRRNWYNNTRGLRGQNINVFHVDQDNKVLAFHRWDQGGGGDDVVIVLNFGAGGFTNYSLGFPRAGHWQVRFNSDSNGYDAYFGNWFSYGTDAYGQSQDLMPVSGNVGFAPYSAIILSQ
jgi:1,4-alpha-glucan branching enzyme